MTSCFKCPWLPYPESFFFWLIDWLGGSAKWTSPVSSSISSSSASDSLARTWSKKDKTCCCSCSVSSSSSTWLCLCGGGFLQKREKLASDVCKSEDWFPWATFPTFRHVHVVRRPQQAHYQGYHSWRKWKRMRRSPSSSPHHLPSVAFFFDQLESPWNVR